MLQIVLVTAVTLFTQCVADETPPKPAVAAPDKLPEPGPDLLKLTPEQIEAAYAGRKMPEAIEMYLVIAKDAPLDGDGGWFHPAANRFSWERLVAQVGGAPDQPLTKEKFSGKERIFEQLDRDHDGMLTGFDLDWSDSNPWVRQSYMINRIFRRIDPNGDGLLSPEEWQKYFERVSRDGQPMRFEQLRDAWLPPAGGFVPGDAPSKEMLIKGFLEGELGSLKEGPSLDEPAPDFTVKSLSGTETVKLSEKLGKKPVVLVFGNFTCGPFRSMYPTVEAVWNRQKDHADFLFVYVREAHPTDGWVLKSNEKAGVVVAQPKTFEERQKVASQCAAMLKPNIPFHVDDVTDTVGNAYSAMPARLYVIDTAGKVAYKSGRGPFGFKPEEMEQALLMLQLEEGAAK